MADEPPFDPEGLANLPALTAGELRVLRRAVEERLRPTGERVDDHSETAHVLWSLHTAISEAIYASQLDAIARSLADD